MTKKYNLFTLNMELRAAGITSHGNCNDEGIVWDDDNNEIQTRPDVIAILEAHNPDAIVPQPATIEEQLEAVKLMIDLMLTDTQGGA